MLQNKKKKVEINSRRIPEDFAKINFTIHRRKIGKKRNLKRKNLSRF